MPDLHTCPLLRDPSEGARRPPMLQHQHPCDGTSIKSAQHINCHHGNGMRYGGKWSGNRRTFIPISRVSRGCHHELPCISATDLHAHKCTSKVLSLIASLLKLRMLLTTGQKQLVGCNATSMFKWILILALTHTSHTFVQSSFDNSISGSKQGRASSVKNWRASASGKFPMTSGMKTL